MKRRYMIAGALLLLAAALAIAACGSKSSSGSGPSAAASATGPATGKPVKIGFTASLTGTGAAPVASVDKGIRLQIEYVNQHGGINGRPLQLVEYDDKSDVQGAVANLNKMIQEDGVVATVGPFPPYMQEAARQVAEQTQTPMVGSGPVTPQQIAGKKYKWSVMISSGPDVQAAALAKMIKAHGWKNVLALADVLSICQDTTAMVAKNASAQGFTFTKMPDSFDLATTDFQPILNKIVEKYKSMKPDAIVLYVNPIAFPALYKGLRELNVTVPIMGGTPDAHPAIFSMGPQAVEGAYVMDAGGNCNPKALPASWPTKAAQVDFADRYVAKYKATPDFYAADGADMVSVLVAAMKKAGSVDKGKVQEALVNLQNVPALQGYVSFTPDATYEGIHWHVVEWVVKNGQFELVRAIEQP